MRRYLFDTGIAADFIEQRLGIRERAHLHSTRGDVIGICVPVLGELVFGIENSHDPARRFPKLHRTIGKLTLWPFDKAAAFRYGELQATLRRRGRTIQVIDAQIAAIALALGNCTIVSKDSDFAAVPGLTVENWAA